VWAVGAELLRGLQIQAVAFKTQPCTICQVEVYLSLILANGLSDKPSQ